MTPFGWQSDRFSVFADFSVDLCGATGGVVERVWTTYLFGVEGSEGPTHGGKRSGEQVSSLVTLNPF
mgnify:CR=1 FL=1